MSGVGRLFLATLLAGVLTAGLLMPYFLGAGLVAKQVTTTLAGVNEENFDLPAPQRTEILAANGRPLTYLYTQNRVSVPISEIAKSLQLGVISIEDRRFMVHGGVDEWGTIRALLSNNGGAPTQGGSTITQQYVKNYLYLVKAKTEAEKADAIEQTPIRKLREMKLALQIDRPSGMSKDEILERYLNTVAFGPSTYGAEAAAQRFFGMHAAELDVGQAAMLAGMVNNPNKFNPLRDATGEQDTIKRRNLVLKAMVVSGAISQTVANKYINAPLGLKVSRPPNGCLDGTDSTTNGFYCQYVIDYLEKHGFTSQQLATGGYTIHTNLDVATMSTAKAAVVEQANPTDNKKIANVMAVVEPGMSTRKVTALVANRPYGLKATARTPETVQRLTTTFAPLGAGSTFKIFTAAAALKLGMGTQSQLGVPAEYSSPLAPTHVFRNSGTFPSQVNMQEALATSPNTTFVSLSDQIGLDKVVQMSVDLGLRGYSLNAADVSPQFAGSDVDYAQEVLRQKVASYTLGVSPVSPLELSNVGATLASSGFWCPPTPVDTVTDSTGKLVDYESEACEQVVPAGLANTLSQAMTNDLVSGTSSEAAKAAGWTRLAAGKTGTTQDYKSSAFLGFTPQHSAAVIVWDYQPRPSPICKNPLRTCTTEEAQGGQGMNGGSIPAATWFQTMTKLEANQPEKSFGDPDVAYQTGSSQAQVPYVINTLADQAQAQLQQQGFQVKINPDAKSTAARNTVIEQSPREGEAALPGSTIVLTVSAGSSGN
ncbi:transglycosylase domain-containing protein [Nakamurella sp. A5-74]|uniref:Transglycosylase domain-containing protein n=1 Tax=Nakamurella sp. A5-74 TaxID=3158264 RepID=A0AAU8DU61_9ACTN